MKTVTQEEAQLTDLGHLVDELGEAYATMQEEYYSRRLEELSNIEMSVEDWKWEHQSCSLFATPETPKAKDWTEKRQNLDSGPFQLSFLKGSNLLLNVYEGKSNISIHIDFSDGGSELENGDDFNHLVFLITKAKAWKNRVATDTSAQRNLEHTEAAIVRLQEQVIFYRTTVENMEPVGIPHWDEIDWAALREDNDAPLPKRFECATHGDPQSKYPPGLWLGVKMLINHGIADWQLLRDSWWPDDTLEGIKRSMGNTADSYQKLSQPQPFKWLGLYQVEKNGRYATLVWDPRQKLAEVCASPPTWEDDVMASNDVEEMRAHMRRRLYPTKDEGSK